MVTTPYHISSPDTGIYNIGNHFQWDLWTKKPWPTTAESRTAITTVVRDYVHDWERQPTFSKEGTEYEVKIREGEWPLNVWFPKKYAVDFVTDHEKFQFRGKRLVASHFLPFSNLALNNDPDTCIVKCLGVLYSTAKRKTKFHYFCHPLLPMRSRIVIAAHSSRRCYTIISRLRSIKVNLLVVVVIEF